MKILSGIFVVAAVAAATTTASAKTDYPVTEPRITIPTPPAGQRWILNDVYSDEFNGKKLDTKKWLDHHPTWKGRAPALFMEENVAVEDGYLKLSTSVLEKPEMVGRSEFTMGGAAVVSKATAARFGYYESRVKANGTSMSTTYWLSRGGTMPVEGNQPAGVPAGSFGQELDICETVGRGGTEAEGWNASSDSFSDGMHANVHFWHAEDGKGRKSMPIRRIPALVPESGKKLSEEFNVYGCWWKDKANAEFYLNNVSSGNQEFITRDAGFKFYYPMSMGVNMVVETYDWIPTPVAEDILDPTKNTSYYDWVRHYVLVDLGERVTEDAPAQKEIFSDYVHFANRDLNSVEALDVDFEIIYIAPENRSLTVTIYDAKDKVVASTVYDAYAGFGNGEYSMSNTYLTLGDKYTVVAELKSGKKVVSADSFGFTAR